jgi:hypothetical protein
MKQSIVTVLIVANLTSPIMCMQRGVSQELTALKNSLDTLTRSLKTSPAIKPPPLTGREQKGAEPEFKPAPFATNGLVIFLDDLESEETPKYEFGIESNNLLQALIQEATPIIASASLITNIRGAHVFSKDWDGKNPAILEKFSRTELTQDYLPTYETMLTYFQQHKALDEKLEQDIETIEKRSVHELVTPATLEKLKADLRKGAEQRKAKQKK